MLVDWYRFIYSSKNKEQKGKFKLIIFILREGVSVSCSIKLECNIQRCRSGSDRSPKVVKSRIIRYVGHVHL